MRIKMDKRRQKILSVLILVIAVAILFCFAGEKRRTGVPEEEKTKTAGTAEGETDSAKEEHTGAGEEETETPVFGSGIVCERSLPEDVAAALKTGDTESLIGVTLGEKYNYDEFESIGGGRYRPKELVFEWTMWYLFDGPGHRFSGFYHDGGEEPFLGINFGETPASIFVKTFGEPDFCEQMETEKEAEYLKAGWYLDRALLMVESWNGYVSGIKYKAFDEVFAEGGYEEELSDFEERVAKKSKEEQAEIIYDWDFDENEKDVVYSSADGTDDCSVEEFAAYFCGEQNLNGREPDSIIYDGEGKKAAEGYIDDREGRFCFILYSGEKVCCAVRDLSAAKEPEYLIYTNDEDGNSVQETLYDIWGMRMAEVFLTYHEGIPFPFLTKAWNTRYEGYHDLCREYKTWFYEEDIEFGEEGEVVSVSNDHADTKSFFVFPCHVAYHGDGRVKKIEEEIPEDRFSEEFLEFRENYFGDIEFKYSKAGTLKKIEYSHSPDFYGTGDSAGHVDFDEQGRMVHNNFYVTSGVHDMFYFYRGEERRPWAVLDWCYDIWSVRVYQPF